MKCLKLIASANSLFNLLIILIKQLSFAMSMMGEPQVVLMDEPSTGMDPQSKRFLWDTISSTFTGNRGAILTTHSMEEADALCNRVGIMVTGELRY